MHPMMKRHEVQVLHRAAHSQREVAALTGVSMRTVRHIDSESEVASVDDEAERAKRAIGRPSKAEPLRDFIVKVLSEGSRSSSCGGHAWRGIRVARARCIPCARHRRSWG